MAGCPRIYTSLQTTVIGKTRTGIKLTSATGTKKFWTLVRFICSLYCLKGVSLNPHPLDFKRTLSCKHLSDFLSWYLGGGNSSGTPWLLVYFTIRYVLGYLATLVQEGIFHEATLDFLIVGHTGTKIYGQELLQLTILTLPSSPCLKLYTRPNIFRWNRLNGCISRNRIFTHWLTDSLTHWRRALSSSYSRIVV